MLFERLSDGTPAPRLPTHKGRPLVPDGIQFFTLAGAVEFFQRGEHELCDLYHRTFGDLFGELADDQVGGFTVDPAKLDAARLNYLRVDRYGHLSDDHFTALLAECRHRQLDIGCHVWAEVGMEGGRPSLKIIVKVDAFRLIAMRTGDYTGPTEAKYLDATGVWHKVWVDETTPPVAARIGVRRKGFDKPVYRIARWKAYAQYADTARGPVLNEIWEKMGPEMLAKCAEALALRTAFPQELAGLYSWEEMLQEKNRRERETTAKAKPVEDYVDDPPADDGEMVIDEHTPETQAEFDAALIALGYKSAALRKSMTSQLKQKFAGEYASPRTFFALAIRFLRRKAA